MSNCPNPPLCIAIAGEGGVHIQHGDELWKFFCGIAYSRSDIDTGRATISGPDNVTCSECRRLWTDWHLDPARAFRAARGSSTERATEPLNDDRDPSGTPLDQLQIGDPVFYWPEGVDAVVEGYEWATPNIRIRDGVPTPDQPLRISAYKLNVGITVTRGYLMRRLCG